MNIPHTITATALTATTLLLAASAVPAAQGAPAPSAGSASSAAPAERAARPHVVKASVNKDTVIQGGRVVISGTVRTGDRGDRVLVQVRYPREGGWKKTKLSDRLNRAGKFRIVDKISSSRSRAYRVVKPAGDRRATGRSRPVRVTVYGWHPLSSFENVASQHTSSSDVKINGTYYPSSVLADLGTSTGSVSYNIERKCRRLETRVGLADTSADTATGTASLKLDGVQKFAGSYRLTQSSAVALPLNDVFRFTFDWTSTNTAGTPEDQSGAQVALGTPRLLCRG